MVKNAGGNKTKGQARKFASGGGKNDKLRLSEDECEVYAIVEKMLGNGMCHVLCHDSVTRLCHIRGKFRGRGKRDNTVQNGAWLLVGLREWDLEKKDETKIQNCDLLEVYQDRDRNELKSTVKNVKWRLFTKNEDDINNSINEIESLKQGICKIESLIISTQEMDKQLAEMNKNQINMSVMFDFEI